MVPYTNLGCLFPHFLRQRICWRHCIYCPFHTLYCVEANSSSDIMIQAHLRCLNPCVQGQGIFWGHCMSYPMHTLYPMGCQPLWKFTKLILLTYKMMLRTHFRCQNPCLPGQGILWRHCISCFMHTLYTMGGQSLWKFTKLIILPSKMMVHAH